ncbi:hypothetical protein JCM8547_006065 [Rhodosporidiobolus lusitaniae]
MPSVYSGGLMLCASGNLPRSNPRTQTVDASVSSRDVVMLQIHRPRPRPPPQARRAKRHPSPARPSATFNPLFAAEYTANLLKLAFPYLQLAQITAFVSALREQYADFNKFRITLRDFLITLREFQGEEATEVFQEEREEELKAKKAEEQARRWPFPDCVLKPSEAMVGDEEEL